MYELSLECQRFARLLSAGLRLQTLISRASLNPAPSRRATPLRLASRASFISCKKFAHSPRNSESLIRSRRRTESFISRIHSARMKPSFSVINCAKVVDFFVVIGIVFMLSFLIRNVYETPSNVGVPKQDGEGSRRSGLQDGIPRP